MPSNERSAEIFRGALHVAEANYLHKTTAYWTTLLAEAEAREAGETCTCADCMPSNWPDTNGWRCRKAREATQLAAAEASQATAELHHIAFGGITGKLASAAAVIEAAEKALDTIKHLSDWVSVESTGDSTINGVARSPRPHRPLEGGQR